MMAKGSSGDRPSVPKERSPAPKLPIDAEGRFCEAIASRGFNQRSQLGCDRAIKLQARQESRSLLEERLLPTLAKFR